MTQQFSEFGREERHTLSSFCTGNDASIIAQTSALENGGGKTVCVKSDLLFLVKMMEEESF
jgi:hypothetical protein